MTGRVVCGIHEDALEHEARSEFASLIRYSRKERENLKSMDLRDAFHRGPYYIRTGRLKRQVSFFGDKEALGGLLDHIVNHGGDLENLREVYHFLEYDKIAYKPKPFTTWPEAEDEAFRDVIKGTTNLDPSKRLTALEVLKLPWFSA